MYNNRPPFNRRNNHQQPPQQPPYLNHPNYLHNLYYHHHHQQQQPPPNNFPNPNPNPNITTQYFNPYNQNVSNNNRYEVIEKIDKAAAKARRELVAKSEYVSVMKVSQNVLLALESCSWDALGVQMNHVPALYSLIMIEGKVV